jgi:hypothetical protein
MAPAPNLANGFGMNSPSRKGEHNSNRESLRLEIHVSQTKQTTEPPSNRELEALFSIGPGLMIQLGELMATLPSSRRQNALANPRKPPGGPKNASALPSFLFRLETTPILCFVRVTANSNRTTFRLDAPFQESEIATKVQQRRQRQKRDLRQTQNRMRGRTPDPYPKPGRVGHP